MKKIILVLVMFFAVVGLASCSLTPQTTIEFSSLPETVYEAGEYTDAEVEALLEKVSVTVTGVPEPVKLTNDILTVSGFDKATLKTPGSYTLVVIYGSVNVTFNYTVVENSAPKSIENYDELVAACKNGGVYELVADLNTSDSLGFAINNSLTIYGNGHNVTNSGSSTRVFNISDVNDITVTLYDLNILSIGQRAVSIFNSNNVNLVLDNCQLKAEYYALNIASKTENINVTIKNGSVSTGWAAVNCWANNSTVNVVDSKLVGLNQSSGESFATVVIDGGEHPNSGVEPRSTGQNNKFNLDNVELSAEVLTNGSQYILACQYGAGHNEVRFNDCKFTSKALWAGDLNSNSVYIDDVRQ